MVSLISCVGRDSPARQPPSVVRRSKVSPSSSLPRTATLLRRRGWGQVIEAPWLGNGGHGASLRHHNVDIYPRRRRMRRQMDASITAPQSAHQTAAAWLTRGPWPQNHDSMIRTKDEMERIVGESQPPIRFLSRNCQSARQAAAACLTRGPWPRRRGSAAPRRDPRRRRRLLCRRARHA
jgi:hypothetical protein